MLHTLSKRIADFLFDEKDRYPLEVYTYGFELIFSSVVELIVLLIVGAMINKFIETLIFILTFCILRIFTGGYHAKTYLMCAILTLITFLFVLISYEFIIMCCSECLFVAIVAVFLFSFCIILKFVPIQNENKELHNINKLKVCSIICLILEAIILFLVFVFLKSNQVLIIIPTIFSVDILMLVEIIRKRGEINEKYIENIIERTECKGK